MSTRGNLTIKRYNDKWLFEIPGDAEPKEIVPLLLKLADTVDHGITISRLQDDLGNVYLGHVGNPCYYYDLNLITKEVKAYNTQRRWVNAPIDWEEKGWMGLYTDNGRLGYHSEVRGKKIDISKYVEEYIFETRL